MTTRCNVNCFCQPEIYRVVRYRPTQSTRGNLILPAVFYAMPRLRSQVKKTDGTVCECRYIAPELRYADMCSQCAAKKGFNRITAFDDKSKKTKTKKAQK